MKYTNAVTRTLVKVDKSMKPLKRSSGGQDREIYTAAASKAKKSRSTKELDDGSDAKKGTWNDMLHLSIKRFDDNDATLTIGAKRNRSQFPYIAIVERDMSGRSTCKHCGIVIEPKGVIRISLMMECHKGYRNSCTLHESCFWKHREFGKINTANEVHIHQSIVHDNPSFQEEFTQKFHAMKQQSKIK